jgi:hypothetical protein
LGGWEESPFFVKKDLLFVFFQGAVYENQCENLANMFAGPYFGAFWVHTLYFGFIENVCLATSSAGLVVTVGAFY